MFQDSRGFPNGLITDGIVSSTGLVEAWDANGETHQHKKLEAPLSIILFKCQQEGLSDHQSPIEMKIFMCKVPRVVM